VTIVKSDYPNGEFGFVGQTELRIENPGELRIISVTVDRAAGLLGKQLVSLPCTWYMCVTGHVDLDSHVRSSECHILYNKSSTNVSDSVVIV